MYLSSMSISELAKEYLETHDEFIVPFARLKFGRETWRDALSNAAAQLNVEPTGLASTPDEGASNSPASGSR